jgi:type IV pilus assembly protein PilF
VKTWAVLLVVPVLASCNSNPASTSDTMQGPVSQQVAVGDARQRAKAHTELGMRYLNDNRLNVALDEARVAIQSDSSYPLGYNLLGLVQMYLKEDRAAEENLLHALRLAPTDADINNNVGWFLCQTGRQQQSIQYFVAASHSPLYPTPSKPLTNAGICSLGFKDDKGAEDFLLKALRADSANLDAKFLLADICFRGGRLIEAKRWLEELHKSTEPTVETSWLGLRVERKLGDREAEGRYASQIRRKFKGSREYQLLMQGEFE